MCSDQLLATTLITVMHEHEVTTRHQGIGNETRKGWCHGRGGIGYKNHEPWNGLAWQISDNMITMILSNRRLADIRAAAELSEPNYLLLY